MKYKIFEYNGKKYRIKPNTDLCGNFCFEVSIEKDFYILNPWKLLVWYDLRSRRENESLDDYFLRVIKAFDEIIEEDTKKKEELEKYFN